MMFPKNQCWTLQNRGVNHFVFCTANISRGQLDTAQIDSRLQIRSLQRAEPSRLPKPTVIWLNQKSTAAKSVVHKSFLIDFVIFWVSFVSPRCSWQAPMLWKCYVPNRTYFCVPVLIKRRCLLVIIPMKTPRYMKGSSVTSQAMLASLTKCIEQAPGSLKEMRSFENGDFHAWKKMDVSENRGTPKWMVYNWGTPIFGNTQIEIHQIHSAPFFKTNASLFQCLDRLYLHNYASQISGREFI